MKSIIFTDLDGTLLDQYNYSYKKAIKALNLIRKKDIPLVFCTSKTRAEIEFYRKKLSNKHPFISENGGAIFIPNNYFNFKVDYDKKDKEIGIKRGSRQIYNMNIGTIPQEINYTVVLEGRGAQLGNLSEKFVENLSRNDIFVLGGRTYQFLKCKTVKTIPNIANKIRTPSILAIVVVRTPK